jgi:hypothetical protein
MAEKNRKLSVWGWIDACTGGSLNNEGEYDEEILARASVMHNANAFFCLYHFKKRCVS